MSRPRVVVVGGGIAGLVSALVLRKGFDVTLVERDVVCGGLLKTYRNPAGVPFDYGTHVLGETGIAELDSLVFDRVRDGSWNRFKSIKAGNFFRGALYEKSPHVDLRKLPKPLYDQAIAELLKSEDVLPSESADLEAHLTRLFGPTITREAQAPALRKIFGCELKDLLPDNPFALRRFIAFDEQKSREKKQDPRWDRKLAFNSYDEGVGKIDYYYPKQGSMGQLTENICRDLLASGVELLNGRFVKKIMHKAGRVESVQLDDGRSIECAHVAWSVPPFLLLKALDVQSPSAPPKAMPTGLFYFQFDRPFRSHNHYDTIYDAALKMFRVTFFPNLRGSPEIGPFNCTVEVIGAGAEARFQDEIRKELEVLGAVEAGAKMISCDFELLPAGFPALTHAFVASAAQQVAAARSFSPGVVLLGRAKFDAFSTESVMVEALKVSKQLLAGGV